MIEYTVVVPTAGRDTLDPLLETLTSGRGPAPAEILVIDDRAGSPEPLDVSAAGVRVLRSHGGGPAAARNVGWRAANSEWVAFLDDDVRVPDDWMRRLAEDLHGLPDDVAASQAVIEVPLPEGREPTDAERDTAGLAGARWITADMSYRRSALAVAGGFDERFPRAYREDADLALRVLQAGYRIIAGRRVTTHPARQAGALASLRAQRGNADNALMRAKHGRHWRTRIGEGRGMLGRHAATTAAAMVSVTAALARRPRTATAAAAIWAALSGEFAARRIRPGPRTPREISTMVLTSILIPPTASWHRLRGEVRSRTGGTRPAALLFDRDDTLIVDVPYLHDPALVRPLPGAAETLRRARRRGMLTGVVSNQSGVAKGLIDVAQLTAVNRAVDDLLGPFDTWQVCTHDAGDDCGCRKPQPGLVRRAAAELGVPPGLCVMIGDTGADVDAAEAAGAHPVLVPSHRTRPEEVARARRRATVAPSIADAVTLALRGIR